MAAKYPNIEHNESRGFRFDEKLYFRILEAKKEWIPKKQKHLSIAYSYIPESYKKPLQLKLF